MVLVFLVLIVSLVLFLFGFFFTNNMGYSNISSFESGFSSVGLVQNSFSVHFFLIMLIFILFDLEICMFVGLLISDINSLFVFLFLFFFVIFSFYMEWWFGKFIWYV